MSSTKTPAASDKVDVSFATDDEEETSTTSEDEATSSSESDDDVKSDDDGDADDESEMPTFTLSLQPSTETNDADDALPDLSQSKQQTQQQLTGASDDPETQTEVTTFQLTLSSVSDTAQETPPELLAKGDVDEESVEESGESEVSEEEAESEGEEQDDEEQNLPSTSLVATSSSTLVSTKVDAKGNLTITNSKISITESKTHVKEIKELAAVAVVDSKASPNADEASEKSASSVKEVENISTSGTKVEEKSKQATSLEIETEEHISGLSTTAATVKTAKPATTNDADVASDPSVSNPDSKSPKKKKDSASKEAKADSLKADTADSIQPSTTITVANDLKHEDGIKETTKSTHEKATKFSDVEATETMKPSIKLEDDKTKEVKEKEQSETVDSPKSGKSRKTKVSTKETKQKETVEEDKAASVLVTTQQNTENFESDELTTSKTISIADAETKVSKEKEVTKHDQNVSALGATKVETTNMAMSEKLLNEVISQQTEVNNAVAGVCETAAVTIEKEIATETKSLEKKPSSKKKDSTVDTKESEITAVDSPTSVNMLEHDDSKSNVTLKSVEISSNFTASETGSSRSAITVSESGLENEIQEAKSEKDKSLPEANFSDKISLNDTKLKGAEDEGKSPAAEDEEFRPRRNSIDDFIKRILAEAREEQKKIFDSCAVASGAETTSETSTSASIKVADGPISSKETELEPDRQPMVNGVDANLTTKPARRNLDDLDIDSELADISRYYAKRTLLDRVSTNDEELTEFGSVIQTENSARSKITANGDNGIPPTSNEEVLHFVPLRRESTTAMVRESSRPVRVLVDQQTSVIRQLTEASRSIDELDNEIRQLRQSTGGREALYASVGAAVRDEIHIYEMELAAAGERLGQQKLPGGGHFIREQFVAQCASELLQKTAATNGPRLDRTAIVDDWTRVGRRRSGSFSEDLGGSSRIGTRPWIPGSIDRDTTDLMIQYRHSRSGSVVSDRGYSSYDVADEPRTTTSSLLSRLSSFNGSATVTEPDFGRYSRASSEAPRFSHPRSQPTLDDWTPNNSAYSVARQYVSHVSYDSAEDTNGELDVGYRVSAAASRPAVQHIYRRYQQPSVDTITSPHSRLYVRRGSLQGYNSYDSGSSIDAGRSFNSRFLSRVREKKALGETTATAVSDRPFRSRFLKSSSVTGSTSTAYSSSRSATQYDSDDN